MKIGIFLPNATFDQPGSPEVGGIESFSFTIGEALQALGHEVVLFGGLPKFGRTFRPSTLTLELHPYWETKSIPDIGTRFQRLIQRLHFAWSIRKAWRHRRVDLVLLAKPFDWPVAWWWKKSRPELKTIMGFHGTDFFAGDRPFYSAIDAAFAVSPRVADLAEAQIHRRPVAIPNPVDLALFHPGSASPPSGPWHLTASGRLIGWKGFSLLLDALARLHTELRIDFRFTLAGTGPEQEKLTAQVARLGLAKKVTLCGRLNPPALADLLRSGELYIAPSIGLEAFSISTLEALCCGLPLLLSDQVGLADFLDERDAVVYPARDLSALTAALVSLHARRHDPLWRDAASRHARHRDTFSARNVAQRILALVAP